MTVTIPFAYRAEVLFGRSSAPVEEVFLENLEIDIPEYDACDLPIALRYRTQRQHRAVRYQEGTFLGRMEDGFEPITQLDMSVFLRSTPSDLSRYWSSRHGTKEQDLLAKKFGRPLSSVGKDPDKVKEWFSSERDKALSDAKDFFGRFAWIDGELWFPHAEPKLSAVGWSVDISKRDVQFAPGTDSHGCPIGSPCFHIASLDEVFEYMHGRYPADRVTHSFVIDSLDIRLPEVFTFDRGRHALEWASNAVLYMVHKDLPNLPDHAIQDWVALKRVIAGGISKATDDDLVALVEQSLSHVKISNRSRIEGMLQVWEAHSDIHVPSKPLAFPGQ